jgi:hypothetical protein
MIEEKLPHKKIHSCSQDLSYYGMTIWAHFADDEPQACEQFEYPLSDKEQCDKDFARIKEIVGEYNESRRS